jgi:hypothetical protein
MRPVPAKRRDLALAVLISFILPGWGFADTDGPAEGSPESGEAPKESTAPAFEIRATPLTSPVRIDGVLDEPAWAGPSAHPLVQNEPDNGFPPRHRTDWWVAYDPTSLYLACRMYDSAPESISCGLGRRDTWPTSDYILLNIDTFNDDRNGYEFFVTPAGAFADAVLFGDGAEDDSWDGIWSYRARVDSLGWTAEIKIPFSQIKFPDKDDQRWGINLGRRILRHHERDDLMHMPRETAGYVSRFPDLVGIRGIRAARRLELLTYGVGKGDFRRVEAGDPFRSSSELHADFGSDFKWPVTNDLTLNATVNPDFGQVEVDPAVINLSDTETFYEERRPFFVQDANIFRFGREGTNNNWNFNWMDPYLFYSRRIGQAPQVSLYDHDFANVPGTTTILGAGKAAGTIGKSSVGVLSAWTAEEIATLDAAGVRSSQIVQPLVNYTVVRVLRAKTDGGRGLGLMATNTWRNLNDARSRSELARDAAVLGIDGWTRLDKKGVWALRGYLDGSLIGGDAAAIGALQRSSRHYYQRPDAGHLRYDPGRTSISGWIGRAMLNKQSGRTTLNASVGTASPGFDASDAGYSSRADVINTHVAAGYRWLDPGRVFRYQQISLASYGSWDTGWNSDAFGGGLFWNATFKNYWWGSGQLFYNPARYSLRATRGGPTVRFPDNREASFGLGSDEKRRISFDLFANLSRQGDASGSVYAEIGAAFRPRESLKITFSPTYTKSLDHSGWVGSVSDPAMAATYGSRYLFSTLDYHEVSMSTRIDCTFTPRLTLQAYLQPLIGVGTYSDLKELSRPRAYDFSRYGIDGGSTIAFDSAADAYLIDPDGPGPAESFTLGNPDFNSKSLKVNLVLRWEYMPGSTFYLVWTQNRTDARNPGDFRMGRDIRSLFDSVGENSIQAKITRWWDI